MYPYVAWQAKRRKGDQERLPTRARKPKQKEKDWHTEANLAKKCAKMRSSDVCEEPSHPIVHLGGILGTSWRVFAVSWGTLWGSWGPLGHLLGGLWGLLGASWGIFGTSWATLGGLWEPLGQSLGPLWDSLWNLWRHLGGLWGVLGAICVQKSAINGSQREPDE